MCMSLNYISVYDVTGYNSAHFTTGSRSVMILLDTALHLNYVIEFSLEESNENIENLQIELLRTCWVHFILKENI